MDSIKYFELWKLCFYKVYNEFNHYLKIVIKVSVNNNLGLRRWIKYSRFMIEVIRYKLKDMVQRKFDFCYGYKIDKWRNKLKFLGYFVLRNTCRQVLNTPLRLGQWCSLWDSEVCLLWFKYFYKWRRRLYLIKDWDLIINHHSGELM